MKSVSLFFLGIIISIPAYMQKIDPAATELWQPVPPVVNPGGPGIPPSDAIVLFQGKNLDEWTSEKGGAPEWKVEGDFFTVVAGKGTLVSRRSFGDCQMHIEWRAPEKVEGEGQGRGNSGIFFLGQYEIQVLDCYNNTTYSNGQTASVYKQHIPLVNACRKPGEWQEYDIIFTAPRFGESGRIITPATVTVLHNGILVQNHVYLWGNTQYIGLPRYEKHEVKAPIRLQDHGNPVSFRNIWVREL